MSKLNDIESKIADNIENKVHHIEDDNKEKFNKTRFRFLKYAIFSILLSFLFFMLASTYDYNTFLVASGFIFFAMTIIFIGISNYTEMLKLIANSLKRKAKK